MPVESFPLPASRPDPAEAARLLALTQTALEGPIAALSDAAGGGLTQTAGQLQAIRKRLLASAQGRLRATGKDLGAVLDKLHAGAQAALAETAASLSLTAQRAGRRTPYSTPDASADVYWCVRPAPGGPGLVTPSAVGMAPPAPPGSTVSGPYATQGEAQAACGAVGSSTAPAAPQGTPVAFPGMPALPPPAVAPAVDGWECRQQPDGGKFVALHSTPSAVPGTVVIAGPFATYAQANAACSAPAAPPPPPIDPFPLPSPSPPAGGGWICWTSPDGLTVQVSQTSPGPGWRQTGAPWPTEGDARVSCGLQPPAPPPPAVPPPGQPPPATPPPEPLPAPTPLPAEVCTLPDAFQGGIPLPGTMEFCAVQDQVLAWFASAGDAVWGWVLDATDPVAINAALEQLRQQSSGILASTFTAIMVPVAQWITSLSAPVMQRVHDALLCLRDLVARSLRCNVQQLLSLLALKTVVSFTKEIQFGTLGGTFVVAQDTFDLALGQFEKVLDYLIAYACPAEIPSQGEAAEAFLRGLISREYYECLMRLHGMAPETFEPFLLARSERLNPKEAIQFVRRHGGSPEEEDDALRRVGFYDGAESARFRELYDELPTIGDHLEWLRKNVFDEDYVRHFNLLDGFGTQQDIADVGYDGYQQHPDQNPKANFWEKFGLDLRALGMQKKNAANHYAAHWLNPSFSQLFEMTQRNRPGRVPKELEFSKDDLLRVMTEMDVGVYFRRRLESVSHPTINLTLCMKLFANGAFTPEEFFERLKDLGFDGTSAEYIRRGLQIEIARLRASSGRGWNPAAIAKAVGLGLMGDEEATKRMAQVGYTKEESEDMIGRAVTERTAQAMTKAIGRTLTNQAKTVTGAYALGIIDHDKALETLKTIGYPEDVASNALLTVDIGQQIGLVKAGQTCIKRALSKGKMKADEAMEQLKGIGVGEERAQELVKLWGVQCAASPPQATAAQILRWVAQGLLPAARARERLINLGWGDPDLMLQLANAESLLRVRQGRVQSLLARSAQGQAREIESLQRQAVAQQARLAAAIRRVTPPSKLISWYVSEQIGPDYLRARLNTMGITGPELEEYIREAERRRTEARARAARAGS